MSEQARGGERSAVVFPATAWVLGMVIVLGASIFAHQAVSPAPFLIFSNTFA